MLNHTRARAEDVRALALAIGLGSGAGLLLGLGYLAVSPGHAPTRPAPIAASGAPVAALGQPARVAITAPPVRPETLRDRFKLAAFTHAVARPFHFADLTSGGQAQAGGDQHCLAEAVYFEARGEAREGQQAVAQVVLNRVRHPAFPKSICAVVHQRSAGGCQFSFVCRDQRAALNSTAWRRAETVASAALHGVVMAAVGDATHFQSAHAGPFAGLLKVAQVGAHAFYRFSGHATVQQAAVHAAPLAPVEIAAAQGRVRIEYAAFRLTPGDLALPVPKPAEAPAVQVAAVTPAPSSAKAALAATPPPAADPRKPAEPPAAKPAVSGAGALAQS